MQTLTINEFYAKALSPSDRCEALLKQVKIGAVWGQLLIDCPRDDLVQAIRGEILGISERAIAIGIDEILLSENGKLRSPINPRLVIQWVQNMPPSFEATIPIIQTIPTSSPVELAIIRMSDNKGLFITDKLATTDRANPNDWLGGDIGARFNIREHFEPYASALSKHQSLTEYSLICLDGSGNKQEQIVNAWLTTWRGDLCRVVEVLSKKYI